MTPTKSPSCTVRDGLDNLAQRLAPPLLNAYFHGQLLSAEGLEEGQLQARYAAALLARLLTPTGVKGGGAVLIGLEVTLATGRDPAAPPKVLVSPGVALDDYGRLVVVPEPGTPSGNGAVSTAAVIDLADHLPALSKNGSATPAAHARAAPATVPHTATAPAPAAHTRAAPATVSHTPDSRVSAPKAPGTDFDLVLQHALVAVREAPVLAGDTCGNAPEYAPCLYRQDYRLELRPHENPPDPPSFKLLFPFEPPPTIALTRPVDLIAACHRTIPQDSTPGLGRAIAPAVGIILARLTVKVDGDMWKIEINPASSPPRREVVPLATLTQLVLDLAQKVDSSLRRRTLSIESGNAQTGEPGAELTNKLVVHVFDATGSDCAGAEVLFHVTGGDGALSAPSAKSDWQGLAEASWTLGPDEGLNTVEAWIKPASDVAVSGPVSFVALGEKKTTTEVTIDTRTMVITTGAVVVPETVTTATTETPLALPSPPPRSPSPASPPVLKQCEPLGRLNPAQAAIWLNNPVLTLTFDQAMDRADFERPSAWLRVFRMKRVEYALWRDVANFVWALSEFWDNIDELSLCAPRLVPLTPVRDEADATTARFTLTLPADDDAAVFLVLIDPSGGHPRAAEGGRALAGPISATGLTDLEFSRLWDLDDPSPRDRPVAVDWRHLVPRPSTSEPPRGGPESGRSHAVFYLGHPHGFDAPEDQSS